MVTRRGFLGMMVGGVAAAAAVRTWPFRVFSFPTEIAIPSVPAFNTATWQDLALIYYDREAIEQLKRHLLFDEMIKFSSPLPKGNEVIHFQGCATYA